MSPTKFIIFVLLSATWPMAMAQPLDEYRGIKVPPYPAGFEKTGEHLVSAGEGKYILSTVKRGSQWMWWLEKIMPHDNQAIGPIREVRQVFIEPELRSGYAYVHAMCKFKGGSLRRDIIAMVKNEPNKKWYDKISQAWRVNVEAEQIETVTTKNLMCRNLGWGD